MACEVIRGLTRTLMDDFRQKRDLVGIRGKQRELESAEADLAESNTRFTEHRLACPVCRAASGPVLVPKRNPVRSINIRN